MTERTSEDDFEFDLAGYWAILSRRIWIVVAIWVGIVLCTALVTFNTRPVFQSSCMLIIEKERGGTSNVNNGVPTIESGDEDYYQTQYKLLKSETLIKTVFQKLNLAKIDDFAEGYEDLEKALVIAPVPRSRLVYVRVNSHHARIAADIANTVAAVYIEQNVGNQLFISKDILGALQNNLSSAEARKIFESMPAVVNNPVVQQFKKDAANLRSQLADLSSRYTPRHPKVLSVAASLRAAEDQLYNETERIIKSLKMDLSGQLMGNNIRLIDVAVPATKPLKPRKMLNLALSLVGGLLAGFFAAMLVEMIDQTLRTQEDVESRLKLPFLGIVPLSKQSKTKTAYDHMLLSEPSLTSEAIRNLRTMVDFAEFSQKNKSFLVTSSIMSEGKSYISSNLAASIAQAGEKVLLVDGDLRRSNLHRLFRVSNASGLSGFLVGSGKVDDLNKLVQATDVTNLSILTCGPRPPNPAELLNTPRLSAFVAWACAQYDRVIVDCPPIFPISDALLWGRYINNCAFVVKFGKTRIPLVRSAVKHLSSSGIKVLGAVLNMSKLGGLTYSHSGTHHHQYNYQYEADDSDSQPSNPHNE